MLARCVARCWDSQATKRYWMGDVADLPEDHDFFKAGHFVKVEPKDMVESNNDLKLQLMKSFEMIAELQKELKTLQEEKSVEVEEVEEKRGPGRPRKE